MSRTVMITGCDRGIGLGLVKQFLCEGCNVISTCLDPTGSECHKLSGNKDCTCVRMDVCDDASIQKAFDEISDKCNGIDILINNAGIASKNHPDDPALKIDRNEMLNIYNTDVIGALSVAKFFKPLLDKGSEKKIVNISSNMGSISLNEPNNEHKLWVGNTTSYRCAKAALNMGSRNLAYELPDFVVVAIHPGWVDTQMGSAKGEVKPPLAVEECSQYVVNLVAKLKPEDSSKFFNYDGKPIPW